MRNGHVCVPVPCVKTRNQAKRRVRPGPKCESISSLELPLRNFWCSRLIANRLLRDVRESSGQLGGKEDTKLRSPCSSRAQHHQTFAFPQSDVIFHNAKEHSIPSTCPSTPFDTDEDEVNGFDTWKGVASTKRKASPKKSWWARTICCTTDTSRTTW